MALDYVVESGETLTLEDEKIYQYSTLTLMKGAKIQVNGSATLLVDTLVKEDE